MDIFSVPIAEAAGAIANAPSFSHILMNVLYFLLSVVGIVAILSLVIAGLRYMIAFGDTEKVDSAKRMTGQSVIGIAVILGALMIVRGIESFFVQ